MHPGPLQRLVIACSLHIGSQIACSKTWMVKILTCCKIAKNCRAMSSGAPITLGSLKFIKPATLAGYLKDSSQSSKVSVIDVRDSDHIGGEIKGSQWIPTDQLPVRMPELLRTLKGKDRVIFHCMLSQQRGPKAALQYARAKAYAADKEQRENAKSESSDEKNETSDVTEPKGQFGGQEICVLEGGFGSWATIYGEDQTLTEGFQKDLWESW